MTATLSLKDQVIDQLRDEIRSGRYAPGDRLPTEERLMAEHGVSRGTVRVAYRALAAEGLAVSQGTRGHYVRRVRTWDPLVLSMSRPERNLNTDDDGPHDVAAQCVRDQGRVPSELIRTEIVLADERAQRALQLPGPEPLLVRRRIRYVDGEPFSTADSFYLRQHVAGSPVELPEQVRPGVYAVYAERGLPWVRTEDYVGSRMPTKDETRELRIPAGVPVLEVIRVSYADDPTSDTNHKLPVRMTAYILPADRYRALFEHEGESR
ncbi:GntR family transcriptional regulator [Micromonospora sp. NPDC049230]|uniref:GntR family transcriptional regulator n=1 Tax=Micromonospora sp. NPDC049230 TaxID=3155502 RepID=UPI0033D11863